MRLSTPLLLVLALAASVVTTAPANAEPTQKQNLAPEPSSSVHVEKRDDVIGVGWRESTDRMWTTSSDSTGFHILVAEAATGFTWRTVASLAADGIETDRWVGNACVTGSGRRLVAVYAPRTYANRGPLLQRGAYTATVDLDTGAVKRLPIRTSMAYFNPGCGTGEKVVLTQGGSEDLGKTGLVTLDAATGKLGKRIEVPGQLTSPVPTAKGIVAADSGAVVSVAEDGSRKVITTARGVPFRLIPDRAGGLVFMDRDKEPATARVRRVPNLTGKQATTLASGPLTGYSVTASATGQVFITGTPTQVHALPGSVTSIDAPMRSTVSVRGEAAVTAVTAVGAGDPRMPELVTDPIPVTIEAQSLTTGKHMTFGVDPADRMSPRSQTDDANRHCAVPRNDPNTQVYQPKPKQVEWAANMAVKGHLEIQRPANWNNNGLPAYTPQGLFPPIALTGTDDGQVPAQIMLGILGQESNLWQAKRHVYPGQTGNALVGNYYGNNLYNNNILDDWDINWGEADCGYGISQMTDGMRRAGYERPGETALPWIQQKAIATDYAANLAAGLRVLQTKWNEIAISGMQANNNDPSRIENWFMPLWAYNSGFHFPGEDGAAGAHGLGWLNNPANPIRNPQREMFGIYPSDFSRPGEWSYPERVLGFAAFPPSGFEAPGVTAPFFRPAWWGPSNGYTADQNRLRATPPHDLFCTARNDCEWGALYDPNDPDVIGEPAGPCAHQNDVGQYDLKCWWHDSVTWKTDCETSCGNEFIRYDYPDYAAEPANGSSFPAACGTAGLPPGTLVVDDVPNSVPPISKPGCQRPANAGTFTMDFGVDDSGREASKIDLHQVGGGYGAHFWFTHTNRRDDFGQKLRITGTWTFNQTIDGWARVMVHIPDHGAHTRRARYVIDLGNGTRFRVLPQRIRANKWVSLGSFPFNGTPKVTLDNFADNGRIKGDDQGRGAEDIAWDAVAITPLPAKPRHIIAALGDSYASGEGASVTGGGDYYPATDIDGDDPFWRNACHRSTRAWSREMRMADSSLTVGQRADNLDSNLDFRMIACSGARTQNLLPSDGSTDAWGNTATPQYGEVSQLDSGWVDQDTTLVTLSIGGNDARFTDVLTECYTLIPTSSPCQLQTMGDDARILEDSVPEVITTMVGPSVRTVLTKIHAAAPNAKIVLVGYPHLFAESMDPYDCPAVDFGIDPLEGDWLNSMGDVLDEQLAAVVADAVDAGIPAKFSDPRVAFEGRGVCGDSEEIHSMVFDFTPGDSDALLSAQSFHPKIEGAVRFAGVVTATLREFGL